MKKGTSKNQYHNPTTLFSIYGVRDSKDGKRFNITLISGEDDNLLYATISLKKNNEKIVKETDDYIFIKVKKLKPREEKEDKEEDLPF